MRSTVAQTEPCGACSPRPEVPTPLELCHEFPFSSNRYIEIFFDRDFVHYLRDHLDQVDEYHLEILERTEDRNLRTIKVAPRVELPKTVRRLLGRKRISWLETPEPPVRKTQLR